MKRVALITCASNFERQYRLIESIHRQLLSQGDYVLFVLSNYGVFADGIKLPIEQTCIYELIDYLKLDGAIIDTNMTGNASLAEYVCGKLQSRNIPFVTVDVIIDDFPYVIKDNVANTASMLEHLISVHDCKKINLVVSDSKMTDSHNLVDVYRQILSEKGIPFDPERIFYKSVSMENGSEIFYECKQRRVSDCDAILFYHDVLAIGFVEAMEDNGYQVPDNCSVCSLNYSTNSELYRPSITGVSIEYSAIAQKAVEVLTSLMKGKTVDKANYYPCEVCFRESCGCKRSVNSIHPRDYKLLVKNKINAGGEISQMMHFNYDIEGVTSIRDLCHALADMLDGIGAKHYFCNINKSDLGYIAGESDEQAASFSFGEKMVTLAGRCDTKGLFFEKEYNLSDIVPVPVNEGDMIFVLPIGYQNKIWGYMSFVNDYMPIKTLNYRICHESIACGLMNLHRKKILMNTVEKLEELHMTDALTGLYNRFALRQFKHNYEEKGNYTVVMMDMDGLKSINDGFGHLAGNHAISLTARTIEKCIPKEDLLIRYGGDEFLLVSYNIEKSYWKSLGDTINKMLQDQVKDENLPYNLGISVGFSINIPLLQETFEECCELADRKMYQNKKDRKAKL